ncbi:MAG TPA: RDD family protein [Acidimicrobiales bacterium]|nr:RDD family protein [Acidimicrobiales bacterium]
MGLESRLVLRLAEGAHVELRIAGVASRALAAAIDLALGTMAIFALTGGLAMWQGELSSWWLGSGPAFAVLAVVVGLPLASELLFAGATPGKTLLGLRVVAGDGGLLTAQALLVRNVLRVVDALPFPYGVGLAAAVVSDRGQRLGDLAAGTVVVRQIAVDTAALAPPTATALGWAASRTTVDPRIWDTAGLADDDLRAVRRFLERRATLPPGLRTWAADELARRVGPKLVGAPTDLPSEALLEGAVLGRLSGAEEDDGARR